MLLIRISLLIFANIKEKTAGLPKTHRPTMKLMKHATLTLLLTALVGATTSPAMAQLAKLPSGKQLWGNVIYCASWDNKGEWGTGEIIPDDERPFGLYEFAPKAPSTTYARYTDLRLLANGGAFYRNGKFCFVRMGGVVFPTLTYQEFDTSRKYFSDADTVALRMRATDLAYDHTTGHVYGSFRNPEQQTYEIGYSDFRTDHRSLSRVTLAPAEHTYLAMSIDRAGQLYAISSEASLYRINKQTGEQTLIGSTGIHPDTYNVSACFDLSDNTLYWTCVMPDETSALYTVDITTGKATKVMDFRDEEQITGLYMTSNDDIIATLQHKIDNRAGHLLENLKKNFGALSYDTIRTLKVTGEIDGYDLLVLRRLCGGPTPSTPADYTDGEEPADNRDITMLPLMAPKQTDSTRNVLARLDLSEATLKTGSDSVYYADALYYYKLRNEHQAPSYMFARCPSLRYLSLPQGIDSLGRFALSSNPELQEADVPDNLPVYGNYCYMNCKALSVDSLHFGPAVRRIGKLAFNGVKRLRSVVLPDQLHDVGMYAFAECDSLRRIEFGRGLTVIPGSICWKNPRLEEVVLPEGIDSIWGGAFAYCTQLRHITLPSTITYLGSGAFAHCSQLMKVVCLAQQPPRMDQILWDDSTFTAIPREAVLYVPKGTKATYEADASWRRVFAHILELGTTDIATPKEAETATEGIYDIQGRRVPQAALEQNGTKNIYLLRKKDGSVRKIIKR